MIVSTKSLSAAFLNTPSSMVFICNYYTYNNTHQCKCINIHENLNCSWRWNINTVSIFLVNKFILRGRYVY